jgi:hypothetical protein
MASWQSTPVQEAVGRIRKFVGRGGFVVVPGAPHEYYIPLDVLECQIPRVVGIKVIVTAESQPVEEGRLPEVCQARLVWKVEESNDRRREVCQRALGVRTGA